MNTPAHNTNGSNNNNQKSAAMLKVSSLMKQGILSPAIKGLNPSSIQSAISQQQQSLFATPVKPSSNGLFSEEKTGVVSAAAFMSTSNSPVKEVSKENTPNVNTEQNEKNWMKSKRLKQFADHLKEMDGVESLVKQREELEELKEKFKIMQEANNSLHDQLSRINEEKKQLAEEVSRQKQDVAEQRSAKQTLLKELSDKTTENIDLQNQLQRSKQRTESLRSELSSASAEKHKLSEDLQASTTTNDELRMEAEQVKGSVEKKNEQLRQSMEINEQLQKTSEQTEFKHKRELTELEQHMTLLKQEYFFSMALAVKLTMMLDDQSFHNRSIHSLWDRVSEKHMPVQEWKNFATESFSSENDN